MTAMTLAQRLNEVAPDSLSSMSGGAHTKRLFLAAQTISTSDTSRFSLEHVLQEKSLLTALHAFPEPMAKVFDDFFKIAKIDTPEDQEAFLGILGASIRLFPELNIPFDPAIHQRTPPSPRVAQITAEDHRYFVKTLDLLRTGDFSHVPPVDFGRLLTLFMETKSIKQDEKTNFEREKDFARALQRPVWTRHEIDFQLFSDYLQTLNKDSPIYNQLAKGSFVLATQFQPGGQMLRNDDAFKHELQLEAQKLKPAYSPALFGKANPLQQHEYQNIKVAIKNYVETPTVAPHIDF
jgi:hypothetical protein